MFREGKPVEGAANQFEEECKQRFFAESDDQRFFPRAVLIDSETRVLDSICQEMLFNPESVLMTSVSGEGAGNNWARGFSYGKKFAADLMEVVRVQLELCDNPEGFLLCHSIAGGTGSGVGSMLMEAIKDAFPRKVLQTYSVFPGTGSLSSDVVVQPYNSLLTLGKLSECADAVVSFENNCLDIILKALKHDFVNNHANELAAKVMTGFTLPLRFPLNSDKLCRMIDDLVPIPSMNFLCSALAPIKVADRSVSMLTTSAEIVMRRLINKRNWLACQLQSKRPGKFISCVNILSGKLTADEVWSAQHNVKSEIEFANFSHPKVFKAVLSGCSPRDAQEQRVKGTMIANHSRMGAVLKSALHSSQTLLNRSAYLHSFEESLPDIRTYLDEST